MGNGRGVDVTDVWWEGVPEGRFSHQGLILRLIEVHLGKMLNNNISTGYKNPSYTKELNRLND